LFLGNIANGWDVQNDQRDETKFRNQDLQVGMSAGTSGTISASMKHKMGLIQVNMPSQTVYLTRYYQYVNNEWELNNTKNSNVANQTTASGATDFTNSTWKPWAKTTSSCYLIGKPDDGALPISANRGTSNSYYSWEVTDKEITAANAIVTENLSISSTYLKQAWEFSYTGTGQAFTIPAAGTYCFECWGAQGGQGNPSNYDDDSPYSEYGRGGYTKGEIVLSSGLVFYIYVGGEGVTPHNGWNGGGYGVGNNGGAYMYGGGATDVRNGVELNSRIMVAGGGGGESHGGWGGCGGNLIGGTGTKQGPSYTGANAMVSGGTQSSGGAAGAFSWSGTGPTSGSLGQGGKSNSQYGGGGGGGYYGGGGAGVSSNSWGAGAGGSSYISGYSGCSIHSSYRFISNSNLIMINGSSAMPTTTLFDSNATETGHPGDGFARITQISVD